MNLLVSTMTIILAIASCSLNRPRESPMTENLSVFFRLIDGKILTLGEQEPSSFYVKGHLENGRFIVESQVLGAGQLASSGRPGWMELPSGEFFSQEVMRGVISPYVNGFMTNNGFVPSSREVH